jgi:hypothetical protein
MTFQDWARLAVATLLCMFVCTALPGAALAQDVGTAVDVSQPAMLVSGRAEQVLTKGMAVRADDVVRTGKTGRVQLLFSDDTKMVVGPNAVLKIDDLVLKGGNSSRRLTVTAIGGTFRFITGDSPKRAYKLKTPAATMGVRGTAFDFTVNGRRETGVVVFDGEVRFCGAGEPCARVDGGCAAVLFSRAEFYTQPQDVADKRALVDGAFPLIGAQASLRPPFRVDTSRCGENRLVELPAREETKREGSGDGGGSRSGNPAE